MNNTNFLFWNVALPTNGQLWFQSPASPLMEGIVDLQLEMSFHCMYILLIVVYGLIGSVILFNESANNLSSTVAHWTLLERIYSIIPMFSIVCIYLPSFSLLYAMDEYPDSNVTVKVVGRQWYWHYELTYDGQKQFANIGKFLQSTVLNKKAACYFKQWASLQEQQFSDYARIYNSIVTYRQNIIGLATHTYNNTTLNYQIWGHKLYSYGQALENKLHLKLLATLHQNVIQLPKITNYTFDSYCLSDESIRAKYILPQTIIKTLNNYFLNTEKKNIWVLNQLVKLYLINNDQLISKSLGFFQTMRTNRLLDVTKALIIPTGTPIRALVTSSDVIHSWAIPSLGVKTDGIPGRLNQTFFTIIKDGIYYGQCSELCGQYHFAMPIVIKAMSWYSCPSTTNCFWCSYKF